jgi:hypothetical protein
LAPEHDWFAVQASALLVGIARFPRVAATGILRSRIHPPLRGRLRDLLLPNRLISLPLRDGRRDLLLRRSLVSLLPWGRQSTIHLTKRVSWRIPAGITLPHRNILWNLRRCRVSTTAHAGWKENGYGPKDPAEDDVIQTRYSLLSRSWAG